MDENQCVSVRRLLAGQTRNQDKQHLHARGDYGSPAESCAAINFGESATAPGMPSQRWMPAIVSGPAPTGRPGEPDDQGVRVPGLGVMSDVS